MSVRADAVSSAIREWKAHPEGRPEVYWRDVLPPGTASPADWCGAFYLWNLHQAGIARDYGWVVGTGFAAPADLKTTDSPLPGDLLYVPAPFEHHALIVSYEPTTGMITSIDGNQPGILPKVRFKGPNTVFYSIQPLVDAAEAAQPIWPYLTLGAAVIGVCAWIWTHGVPAPLERGLRRVGL